MKKCFALVAAYLCCAASFSATAGQSLEQKAAQSAARLNAENKQISLAEAGEPKAGGKAASSLNGLITAAGAQVRAEF